MAWPHNLRTAGNTSSRTTIRLVSRMLFLMIVILNGLGCATSPNFTRAVITERYDDNPDHLPYYQPRQVVVSGSNADEIACFFPELETKAPSPSVVFGAPRFEIDLSRSNGETRHIYIYSDMHGWWEQGNKRPLSAAATQMLFDQIRNSVENPVVQVMITQTHDEKREYFEAPLYYFAGSKEAESIALMFPELANAPQSSSNTITSALDLLTITFVYADGRRKYVEVNQTTWIGRTDEGTLGEWPLSPVTLDNLRGIMSRIGKAPSQPSTRVSNLQERMRQRRDN